MNIIRNPFYQGIGQTFSGNMTLDEILNKANLNYIVERYQCCTFLNDGTKIVAPDTFFNIRRDTNQIVGVVSKDYSIVQNSEAFQIVNDFMDKGLTIKSAGHFGGGKSFILLESEPYNILNDNYINYFFVGNSFDGSMALSVKFLPMRLVCSNGLRIIDRRFSVANTIKHFASSIEQLKETEKIFANNREYILFLQRFAKQMAAIVMTQNEFLALCDIIYPVPNENASELVKSRYSMLRDQLGIAYAQDDLQNFNGTAYKAIMAIADYESHVQPTRTTSVSNELPLRNMLSGMSKVNHAVRLITEEHGIRLR